jgi:hypothetical protein
LHDDANTGKRIEGGYPDEWASSCKGEALHTGDADSESGKRARTNRDGEDIDLVEPQGCLRQECPQFARQLRGGRDAWIADPHAEYDVVSEHGATATTSRRIQGQDNHFAYAIIATLDAFA